MEISRDVGLRVSRVQTPPEIGNSSSTSHGGGAGSPVQVSDSARQLNELAKLVHAASDIRLDKVNPIKERLEAGEYQIDLDKLADKISPEI